LFRKPGSESTIIRSAEDLKAADHVSWPTESAFGLLQHHAIVVALTGGNNVKVCHATEYDPVEGLKQDIRSLRQNIEDSRSSKEETGDSPYLTHLTEDILSFSGSGSSNPCEVREDIVDLNVPINNGELRRYDYAASECDEPYEVIEKCRSKKGPFNFGLLTNNCEHHARWCKCGNRESYQADSAKSAAAASSAAVASSAAAPSGPSCILM